ncbi:MAG: GSCFA domain-containing protein [Niabella sp.]
MDFFAPIRINKLEPPIRYGNNILLVGSCFTEHIGNALGELKFNVMQNPNGILFDPNSVCQSLVSYVEEKKYDADDLFYLNELWQSWHHHSRFSGIHKDAVLEHINQTQKEAHDFLRNADWLIITLGSSFVYELNEHNPQEKYNTLKVANCHRAPGQWFTKKMLPIESTVAMLDNCYHRLKIFNPGIKILFTISPVRHLRDGVVENNRSKARLIEAVHHIVSKFNDTYYFPAYELVVDVLRDYRFYDIDLAHPNYAATTFVLEKFTEFCIDEDARELMKEIHQINIARNHRPFQPDTQAHKRFLQAHYDKTKALAEKCPFLNLRDELDYFGE